MLMRYERRSCFSLHGDERARPGFEPVKRRLTYEEMQEVRRQNGRNSRGKPRRLSPVFVAVRNAIARRGKAIRDEERRQASRWYQWPGVRDQAMEEAYRAGVIPEWVWVLRQVSSGFGR